MARKLIHSLISLVIIAGLFSPWVTVLIAPQEAFAQSTVQVQANSALGNQAARQGGSLDISQAAAGGAVSVGACLAAAGITLGAAITALAGFFGISTGASAAATASTGAGVGAVAIGLAVPVVAPTTDFLLKAITANTYITAQITGGQLTKDTVLDCIAWALAKMIWKAIVASVIDWINSGFNGRPAFIQNLPRFLMGIADQAIGSVIQADSTLSFLCSPFSLSIRLALAVSYSRRSAPACTLTQVMKNIKNFMQNFNAGGWPAWIELQQESNNPYGAYLLGRATISLRISSAQGSKMTQLDWGKGFLSKTENSCDYAQGAASAASCKELIVTPGELIAKQAGEVIGQGNTTLLMADELNEVIGALVSALLQKALQSFNGLSGSSSYQDDYYRYSSYTGDLGGGGGGTGSYTSQLGAQGNGDASAVGDSIDEAIQTEKDYQQSNTTAINLIKAAAATQTQAAQCWNGKVNGGSLTPEQSAAAVSEAQAMTAAKNALNGQTIPYQNNIDQSNLNIANLQNIKQQAQNATTQEQLNQVLNTFYAQQGDPSYATNIKIQAMDDVIANLQTSLAPQITDAQNSAAECASFPPPAAGTNSQSSGGSPTNTQIFTTPDLSS